MTYPLHSLGEQEVVFENPERDSPRRFIYRREGENKLFVILESGDGEPWVFEYERHGAS